MTETDPSAIADYLTDVEPVRRELIARYYARVEGLVPEVTVGRSYAMPCYLYRGKGLVSVMATRSGLSVIAFSGAVARQLPGSLDLSEGGGSIRVTLAEPLPDDLFDRLVLARRAEIETKARTGSRRTLPSS